MLEHSFTSVSVKVVDNIHHYYSPHRGKIVNYINFIEFSSHDDPMEKAVKDKGCTCGKNRRGAADKISCVSDNCPCKRMKKFCLRKCRCYNCKNVINGDIDNMSTGGKKTVSRTGCRCGRGSNSNGSEHSCRDGSGKSRCPCISIGCTELCRCLNCANNIQSRVEPLTPIKQRKRKRELVSPYKRKGGKEFMEGQNATVSPGTWRNLETYCLIVCREVLQKYHT